MILHIEFTRPKNRKFPIFSWAIRAIDRTSYSHVRLRWVNTTGVEIVYEASGSSVKFLGPIANKTGHKVSVLHSYSYALDRTQYKKLVNECMTYAGIDYGVKQIIGIAIGKLFRMAKNPLSKGDNSQVCSELVGRIIKDVLGYNLDINLDMASPKDLRKELERNKTCL